MRRLVPATHANRRRNSQLTFISSGSAFAEPKSRRNTGTDPSDMPPAYPRVDNFLFLGRNRAFIHAAARPDILPFSLPCHPESPLFAFFRELSQSGGQITSISDRALPSAAAQTERVTREIHFGLRFRTCIFYRLSQASHCKRPFRERYEISRLYCCAVDAAHHRVFI